MDKFCKILSPIAPHIAEYIYKKLFETSENESVHFCSFPEYNESLIDEKLIAKIELCDNIVTAALSARNKAKIKLRWPIKEITINTYKAEDLEDLHEVEEIIKALTNAEKISYEKININIKVKPNYASLGKKFGNKTPILVDIISKISEKEIKMIEEYGKINIGGFEISGDDIKIETILPEGIIGEKFEKGIVYINTEIDEELFKKGMTRDVIRRIQAMRKDLDLEELHIAECIIEGDEEFINIINDSKAFIEYETRTKIHLVPFHSGKISEIYYVKNWDIEDFEVRIGIKK